MIYLFHGTDPFSSRKAFLDSYNEHPSNILLEAQNLNVEELNHSLSGGSLFEETKEIYIENLLTKKKGPDLLDIASLLSKSGQKIFLWEGKEITKKQSEAFEKMEDRNFKLPSTIFNFLDSLRPSSLSNVRGLTDVLKNSEEEILFFMLVRHFRILLSLIQTGNRQIEEMSRLRDWQLAKYKKQANLFGEEKLRKIYGKLENMDKSIKTGTYGMPIRTAIDFLMLEI